MDFHVMAFCNALESKTSLKHVSKSGLIHRGRKNPMNPREAAKKRSQLERQKRKEKNLFFSIACLLLSFSLAFSSVLDPPRPRSKHFGVSERGKKAKQTLVQDSTESLCLRSGQSMMLSPKVDRSLVGRFRMEIWALKREEKFVAHKGK